MSTVDEILSIAPQASAGEANTIAPENMTPDQLIFQAKQLLGRDVVYTVQLPDGTREHRAGMLVDSRDGPLMRHTPRLSHLRGVRPWVGSASQFLFPDPGTNCVRIVAAHVYQEELLRQANREVDRLLGLVDTLEQRVNTLERERREQDHLLIHAKKQLEAVTGEGGSSKNSPERHDHHHHHHHNEHGNHGGHRRGSSDNSNNDTPATPTGSQASGGNSKWRDMRSDRPIDMSFMEAVFSGRGNDQATCQQWLAILNSNEVRVVSDLCELRDKDWDKIDLPVMTQRRLREVAEGSL